MGTQSTWGLLSHGGHGQVPSKRRGCESSPRSTCRCGRGRVRGGGFAFVRRRSRSCHPLASTWIFALRRNLGHARQAWGARAAARRRAPPCWRLQLYRHYKANGGLCPVDRRPRL
eukprot:Amastigsp_a841038_835.p4 type:complete len:115 gc:universal Amastigsp_a841038_835:1-345(+)